MPKKLDNALNAATKCVSAMRWIVLAICFVCLAYGRAYGGLINLLAFAWAGAAIAWLAIGVLVFLYKPVFKAFRRNRVALCVSCVLLRILVGVGFVSLFFTEAMQFCEVSDYATAEDAIVSSLASWATSVHILWYVPSEERFVESKRLWDSGMASRLGVSLCGLGYFMTLIGQFACAHLLGQDCCGSRLIHESVWPYHLLIIGFCHVLSIPISAIKITEQTDDV